MVVVVVATTSRETLVVLVMMVGEGGLMDLGIPVVGGSKHLPKPRRNGEL